MQHSIQKDKSGPDAEAMAHAVETCVHCGFCLPTCPTYAVLGEEMNSPRGRIILMKGVLEGVIAAEEAQPFIDRCLGCLACETSCPSGVPYGELLSPYRAWVRPQLNRGFADRFRRKLLLSLLPYPARFRLATAAGRLVRPFRHLAPKFFRPMLDLVPATLPEKIALPEVVKALGKRRARVALLAGCAQQVLAPEINLATIRVLAANGIEVVIPETQACCGSLALHLGENESARQTARKNLVAFPSDVDAILTNASGCGTGLREYGHLFRGEPEAAQAAAFADKTTDICTFLDKLGLVAAFPQGRPVKVAYHDACHLAHAQRVRSAPRNLLQAVPGLELLEPAEWELCCGSAGTYNLEQPETADTLGRRKAENLLATGAEMIATGNIGCLTQIRTHLEKLGKPLPIVHTVEILARAYDGKL